MACIKGVCSYRAFCLTILSVIRVNDESLWLPQVGAHELRDDIDKTIYVREPYYYEQLIA